jgi:LmbE family N-acetylglucosaminyl deacetylase
MLNLTLPRKACFRFLHVFDQMSTIFCHDLSFPSSWKWIMINNDKFFNFTPNPFKGILDLFWGKRKMGMNRAGLKQKRGMTFFLTFTFITLAILGVSLGKIVSAQNRPAPRIVHTEKPKPKPVAIYFVPHADDEVLSMATDIVNHQRMGYDIHLVLMIRGEHSGARFVINGFREVTKKGKVIKIPVYCVWHNTYHSANEINDPDGYYSTEDLARDRVKEFHAVAEHLGIPRNHVHVYDLINGRFTEQAVRQVYDEFLSRYPHAIFRTMSRFDYHRDHAFLGQMMARYEQEGKIKPIDTVYFLSIYKARFTKYRLPVKVVPLKLINPQDRKKIMEAAQVYLRWEPSRGWHALGLHSVPYQFESFMKDMSVQVHYDN